jgi:hypothetical protein
MKGLFGFQKTLATLTGAGVAVAIAGMAAFANGGAATVAPCDPNVQTDCVTVFSPVIHSRSVEAGPAFTDIAGGTFHDVITMTGVPNGDYKVEANGILDIPAIDTVQGGDDSASVGLDWSCTLYLVTAENVAGAALDSWDTEATGLVDTTFFLKAAVNINSSANVGTLVVRCANQDVGIWSTASLKIIAVSAADIVTYSG